MRRCWNAQRKQWEACKTVTLASRGGTTGGTPPCCIKPACCLTCADLNRLIGCISNTVHNVTLFSGAITPDEQLFRRYLEFIECAYGINRTNLNFSTVDYVINPILPTYTDVACYASPVSLTNVGVNCDGIWVRQCLVLTPTQIECPTIGVCFETMAVPAVGGLPGEYSLNFRNPRLCLNPVDYSTGSNCDNCSQQPPTP